MKNVKKWILRIAMISVLALILVVAGVLIWINQIAKVAVQKGATYALGVNTTLDSASIRIFSGKFALHGLNVSNPEGYKTSHFMDLKGASLDLPLSQLMGDTVTVNKLQIDGLDMNLEKKSDGTANYEVILANLKKLESGKTAQEQPASDKPAKKYVVKELVINDVTVRADITPIGGGVLPPVIVKVPPITLKNVGSDKKLTIDELTNLIIQTTLASAVANAGGALGSIGDEIGNGLKGLTALGDSGLKIMGDLGDAVGKGLQGVGEGVGKGIDDLGKGLGNIFGGDDKNKKDEKK